MFSKINLLLVLLLLSACSSQVSKDVIYKNLVKIPVKSDDKRVNDSLVNLVRDYRYIKLETKKESLINTIDKILFFKNTILILDKKQNTIFLFDKKGTFTSKINKVGVGPGEYSNIFDFDIDSFGNIYVLDALKSTIFKYSMGGEILSTKKINHFAKNMAIIDSSTVLTFQPLALNKEPILGELVLTKNNQVINSFLPLKDDGQHKGRVTFLKSFMLNKSDKILFNTDLSDTIFEVSKDGFNLMAKYAIDFGKKTISADLRNNPDYFFKNPVLIEQGWQIENYFENSQYFTCSFNLEAKTWVLFYNKKEKKYMYSSCASCSAIKPKILGDLIVKGISDDYFVSIVPRSFLADNQSFINKYPDKEQNFTKDNAELIKKFSDNDNPILVMFKF